MRWNAREPFRGDQRGCFGLEAGGDPVQRLPLAALLLFLARLEVRLAARRMCCERRSPGCLESEDVWLERERVDELQKRSMASRVMSDA